MTPKEALKILDETVIGNLELKIVLSNAFEKQIPQKPNKRGFDPSKSISSVSYTCPICNKHIGRESFCKHCGQALSWGSEDKAK